MSPTIFLTVLLSLAAGTLITMSSYHWLFAWIGLEMNTLAITPIISTKHNPRSTEAATKYFLTQAAASALILFSSMTNAWQTGTWSIMDISSSPAHIMLTLALAMKLGLAPMHFWLPEVLQGTTFLASFIITTWQKLAPMALIFMTINNLSPTALITMGVLSSIIGGLGGLNQTQTRKIMAYSSIAHLGWMITISSISTNLMIFSLLVYLVLTGAMFFSLIFSKLKTVQDTTTAWSLSPSMTTMAAVLLLSLGGLPPLTGFTPKWLIMEELITQNLILMTTAIMLSSLLSLFFYLRLTYTAALTLSPNTVQTKLKWRLKPAMLTTPMLTLSLMSSLLLPILPLILL
uniref:NADH-ubiquinone oxidoreductase chain 2 n=1 Tax=Anolis bitectus TaxID=323571 RepID=Q2M4F1_9SAUR|nr:NADH dehydrogenase subunit 2 [Anolis bitectus]